MEWFLWTYRQIYSCKRKLCPYRPIPRHEVPVNKLPWFWIGAEFPHKTETVTDIVNNHIQYGNQITPEFLSEVTGYTNVRSWKYVDVTTLEEREFPPGGFVIENVA